MKFLNEIDNASMLKQDAEHRLVTDRQIERWDSLSLSELENNKSFLEGNLYSWSKYEKVRTTELSEDMTLSETEHDLGFILTWPGLDTSEMRLSLSDYTITVELSPGVPTLYTFPDAPNSGRVYSLDWHASLFFPFDKTNEVWFFPEYSGSFPVLVEVKSVAKGVFIENVFSRNVSEFSVEEELYLYERRYPSKKNFEQADELSPEYIDGKTHYDYTVNVAEFIYDSSIPLLKSFTNVLIKESPIVFEIDGVKKIANPYKIEAPYLQAGVGTPTGEIYLKYNKNSRIVEFSSEAVASGPFMKIKVYQEHFKQLDIKFIPTVLSDWNQLDYNRKGYIENKPFGKDTAYIGEELVSIHNGEPRVIFDIPNIASGQSYAFATEYSLIEMKTYLFQGRPMGRTSLTGGVILLMPEESLGPNKYILTVEKRPGATEFDPFINDFIEGEWITYSEVVLSRIPAEYLPNEAITTINGKTGAIAKEDIVALGIPDQDTVYTAGTNISISPQNVISSTASGGAVDSVNGKTGVVTLNATEIFLDAEPTASVENALLILSTSLNDKLDKNGDTLENYVEKVVSTTGSIDLNQSSVFTCEASANRTFSIINALSNVSHSFTLIITQGATVRTLTFPASIKWQGGEIPDLTTAGKTYVLTFMTVDGGTTWLGMFGGEF